MTDWTELQKDVEAGTPGPWAWVEEPSMWGGPWRLSPGIMWPDQSDATPGGDARDRANARLIARAPDLAALALAGKRLADEVREISCDFMKGDVMRERLELAEAAFRKAEEQANG